MPLIEVHKGYWVHSSRVRQVEIEKLMYADEEDDDKYSVNISVDGYNHLFVTNFKDKAAAREFALKIVDTCNV